MSMIGIVTSLRIETELLHDSCVTLLGRSLGFKSSAENKRYQEPFRGAWQAGGFYGLLLPPSFPLTLHRSASSKKVKYDRFLEYRTKALGEPHAHTQNHWRWRASIGRARIRLIRRQADRSDSRH